MDRLYGVLLEAQEAAITAYCFRACGKIILGSIAAGVGTLLPCREAACPYLDKEMDAPLGVVAFGDEPVYLRKLVEAPA